MARIIGQEMLHPNRKHAFLPRRGELYLSTDGDRGNVNAGHNKMRRLLKQPLSSMSLDLLDVAAYLYAADKAMQRPQTWVRELRFELSVRNLERWQNCEDLLTRLIARLSGDEVVFKFTSRAVKEVRGRGEKRPTLPVRPGYDAESGAQEVEWDCAILLSGGLDSCAGLVQLLTDDRHPLVISHAPGRIGGVQSDLSDSVFEKMKAGEETKADEDLNLTHLRLRLGPRPKSKRTQAPVKVRDNTQRMRSFLHLALGTVAAQELGIPELYIVDNGILSINLPLVPCRSGSRSSRSTDPLFLALYQELVQNLYAPRALRITNPFLFKTKKDVVDILKRVGQEDVIGDTVSCWAYPRGVMNITRYRKYEDDEEKPTHCGYCLPCLIRRTAVIASGLEDYDAGYCEDVLGEFGEFSTTNRRQYRKTIHLRDLIYFCVDIQQTISEAAEEAERSSRDVDAVERIKFLSKYPELALVAQGRPPDNASSDPLGQAIEMYKRFTGEVLDVVRRRGDDALKDWMGSV